MNVRTRKTLFWGSCAIVIFIYFAFSNQSPESTKTERKTEARIFTDNDKAFAQSLIQAHRYDCTTVENMRDYILGGGFVVKCRGGRGQDYWFNVEDRGGQWFVEYK